MPSDYQRFHDALRRGEWEFAMYLWTQILASNETGGEKR